MAYAFAKTLAKLSVNTYFQDIHVIGEENIPKDGALIVYGNHSNQFVDALVRSHSLIPCRCWSR